MNVLLDALDYSENNFEKKNYYIWSDVGTHFKNNQLAHYCFIELAAEEIAVNLNFFAPKHGKSVK